MEPETQAPAAPVKMRVDTLAALAVFLVLLVLTIVLVALSIPAGIYAVFVGHLSNQYDFNTASRPYLWLGPVVQVAQFTVSLGVWFASLTALYVLFLAYAVRQTDGPLSAIRSSFRDGFGALTRSPFLMVIIGTGFITFTSSILGQLISSSGVPIGSPSGDPLAIFVGFTAAPFAEEFGFRLLLIGIIAVILSVGRSWKDALRALWRPSRVTEGLAIGSGASLIIWAATGFSAVTFGACHVFCGTTTWDIGKFPQAAYGGLVLGVLYVKYGFHVAVLVHWGVDFFGSAFGFFGQAAYGIPWTAGPPQEFIGQYLVDVDMVLLFGVASFLFVVYLFLRGWAGRAPLGGFKGETGGGQVPT